MRTEKPFIYADENPPKSIIAEASLLKCMSYVCGADYSYYLTNQSLIFAHQDELIELPRLPLHANSIAAAAMATLSLKSILPINQRSIIQGVKNLFLPGRLHRIEGRVTTVLDVSHNPQAVAYLANYIKDFHCQGSIHAVFSALKDKDIPALIAPLSGIVDYWYPALLSGKRAASREQFGAAFQIYDIVSFCYDDPLLAYQAACNVANPGDLIIVYGSFVTVGQVLPAVSNTTRAEET